MCGVLFIAALVGCSGTDAPGETDADTGPTGLWPVPSLPECDGPGPNCVDHAMWSETCDGDPAPIDADVVLYEGPLGDYEQPPVQVITDADSWTALAGANAAPVDFDVLQVVVVRYDINSTCGARLSAKGLGSDGTIRVSIEDSSGACEDVCDMAMSFGVAFAVPVGAPPAVCLAVVNTCAP